MKKVKIYHSSPQGKVRIPSSKSDAHRKIISASMCVNQTSVLSGIDFSNDIICTIEAMRNFASISQVDDKLIIKGKEKLDKEAFFTCEESGSTLRFLIPLFAYYFDKTIIKVGKRLSERPLDIYKDIFQDNLIINNQEIILKKHQYEDIYQIKGDISSQFISGLLFVLPLLNQDTTLEVIGNFESKSYVDLTLDVLKAFGIEIEVINNAYLVRGNQNYKARDLDIEGDYSQLAFFGVLGVINSTLEVTNVNKNSLQGDKKIISYIKDFNGQVEETPSGYIFHKSDLIGTTVDIKDTPDLGPILFVLGALSKGKTSILNTRRLKLKESDRIEAMKQELKKFNIDLSIFPNHVEIINQEINLPQEEICSHNDHRIVMALSILATLVKETTFNQVEAINKSYPNFFDDLFNLGIAGEIYED